MHTIEGFTEFLALSKLSGKSYEIQEVAEFTLEKVPVGGPILMHKLPNGVIKFQLPRDAWLNANSFANAFAFTEEGVRIRGVKSIWPESYSIKDITDMTLKAVEENPTIVNDAFPFTLNNLTINVRVNSERKVRTAYPEWKQ